MKESKRMKSAVDYFERWASAFPDAIAVTGKAGPISYGELNSWANGIALELWEQKHRCAVLAFEHQNVEIVAAMLAALKAGVRFTLAPPMRFDDLRLLVRNVHADTVITKKDERAEGVDIINALQYRGRTMPNLGFNIDLDSTAHLGNTSGTTGAPKLAVISHKTEIFQTRSRADGTGVKAGDKVSLMRLNSAAATRDILVGLTSGATVCMLDIGQEDLLRDCAEWINEQEITILFCHIPIYQRIAASGVTSFPSVRVLQLCGGAATVGDYRLYQKYFRDDCVFLNRYGLTETGTVSWLFAGKDTDYRGGLRDYLTVGRPFPGAEIAIVDDEIHVASDYLSPYWDRDDLNRKKFYHDSNDRLCFRTGDMGRWELNGELRHLGRIALNR